jgi:aldehyde dehydrogenase (NAD+)/betaine-aldehyde dehydrogenase
MSAVDPTLAERTVHVDGAWHAGEGAPFTSVEPGTGRELATWRLAAVEQADAAVAAARRSFDDGVWRRRSPAERAAVLRRIAELLEREHETLARLVVAEVGSPISLARTLQTATPAVNFRWAADAAERGPRGGYAERLPSLTSPAAAESVLLREPVGVVTAITPYNYPINMISWKVAPALAAGCSVVLMPSPRGALCAVAFVRLAAEAGLPPGVLNLAPGDPRVGERLCAHPDVDMVTFTGSNAVGTAVMTAAAPTNKKLVLELGGKSPAVVLPGADLDRAAPATILRFCRNAGQGCGATTRILVHRDDAAAFLDRARRFLEALPVGDPEDDATEVGPLISAEHRDRVEGYLRRALEKGATVLARGDRPDGEGFFVHPMLVGDVHPDDEIAQDELFAPIAVVFVYDTLDEAVAIANNTRYGLNALVWGRPEEAREVADRLRTGTVAINGGGGSRPDVPWVGARQSGIGSEMGEDGFAEFFTVKHLQWPV